MHELTFVRVKLNQIYLDLYSPNHSQSEWQLTLSLQLST
jgi:hypothetical protein